MLEVELKNNIMVIAKCLNYILFNSLRTKRNQMYLITEVVLHSKHSQYQFDVVLTVYRR